MSFELSPYELRFKTPGWAPRSGALVRWRQKEGDGAGQFVYGDLHPWEEFGDPQLFAAINSLRDSNESLSSPSPLRVIRRMMACAEHSIHAWPKVSIPVHYLHWDGSLPASLARAWECGIDLLKVKVWHHTNPSDVRALAQTNARVRFRLDGPRASGLASDLSDRLDFVEDATSGRSAWDSRGTSLPCDVAVICKPFRDDPADKVRPGLRAVITSSLNHPFGVAQAASFAEKFSPSQAEVHGVASHVVYESDEFHDLILLKEGKVTFAPYADFVRVLERREWIPL